MVVILYTHVLSVNTLFPDTFSFDIKLCLGLQLYMHTKSRVHWTTGHFEGLKFLVRMYVSQEYKFIFLFKKVQPEEKKMQEVFFCLLTVGGDMIQQLVFSGLSKY